MISTYEQDVEDEDFPIHYMDCIDFFKYGWPKQGLICYTSPSWDIPETMNNALEIMNKNGVLHAVVVIPTTHKIVKR